MIFKAVSKRLRSNLISSTQPAHMTYADKTTNSVNQTSPVNSRRKYRMCKMGLIKSRLTSLKNMVTYVL